MMFPSYENILASEPPFRPNIKLAKYVELIVHVRFLFRIYSENSENSILKRTRMN